MAATDVGKAEAKRVQKDSAITTTPSTGASTSASYLHPSDVNTLVSKAEERYIMVSKLIAAIVRTYRSK